MTVLLVGTICLFVGAMIGFFICALIVAGKDRRE